MYCLILFTNVHKKILSINKNIKDYMTFMRHLVQLKFFMYKNHEF